MFTKFGIGNSVTLDALITRIDEITSPTNKYYKIYARDEEGEEVRMNFFTKNFSETVPCVKKITFRPDDYKGSRTYTVTMVTQSDKTRADFELKPEVTETDYKKFLGILKTLPETLQNLVCGVIYRDKDFKTIPLNPVGSGGVFDEPSGMLNATLKLVKLVSAYPTTTLNKSLMIAAASLYFIGSSNYVGKEGKKPVTYYMFGSTYGVTKKLDETVEKLREEGKKYNVLEVSSILHILLTAGHEVYPATPEAIVVYNLAKTIISTEKAEKALRFAKDGELVEKVLHEKNYYVKVKVNE